MHRREFLASVSVATFVAAVPHFAKAAGGLRDADLRAMLDQFFYARLEDNPEQATSLGLDVGPRAGLKAKLGDASRAGQQRQFIRAKQELAASRPLQAS